MYAEQSGGTSVGVKWLNPLCHVKLASWKYNFDKKFDFTLSYKI